MRLSPGGSELRRLLHPGRSGGVGAKLVLEPSEVALTVRTTPECCSLHSISMTSASEGSLPRLRGVHVRAPR